MCSAITRVRRRIRGVGVSGVGVALALGALRGVLFTLLFKLSEDEEEEEDRAMTSSSSSSVVTSAL
jgi:hypothetical protein